MHEFEYMKILQNLKFMDFINVSVLPNAKLYIFFCKLISSQKIEEFEYSLYEMHIPC